MHSLIFEMHTGTSTGATVQNNSVGWNWNKKNEMKWNISGDLGPRTLEASNKYAAKQIIRQK